MTVAETQHKQLCVTAARLVSEYLGQKKETLADRSFCFRLQHTKHHTLWLFRWTTHPIANENLAAWQTPILTVSGREVYILEDGAFACYGWYTARRQLTGSYVDFGPVWTYRHLHDMSIEELRAIVATFST